MRKLTRHETIEELLRSFNDAKEPGIVEGVRGDGDGVALMSRAWNEGSYRLLEKILGDMRRRYAELDRSPDGIPLGELYWQVSERYLRCLRRTVDVQARRKAKGGKTVTVTERRIVERWHENVRPELVRRGIGWIDREFERRGRVPFLPKEILEVVAA